MFATSASLYGQTPQFEITLERLSTTPVTRGMVVTVETFLRNRGADFLVRGIQIDLPCTLPGKTGFVGTIMTVGAAPITISNQSATASGRLPWLFAPQGTCTGGSNDGAFCRTLTEGTDCTGGGVCDTSLFNGGLRPIAPTFCRFSGSPGPGEEPYTIRGGEKVYLGHIRYTVSTDALGTFNIPYEIANEPCQNTDLSRIVAQDNMCREVDFVPGSLTVAVPCTMDAQCSNGIFCDGMETCVNMACVLGTNPCTNPALPVCNETLDACVQCDDAADCPASTCPGGSNPDCNQVACNAATGSCVCERPTGTTCNDSNECTNPDTCNGGVCSGPPRVCDDGRECTTDTCNPGTAGGCVFTPRPAGTMCGDQTDGECTDPDTCDAAGTCRPNHVANNTPCTSDGNPCTNDICFNGTCRNNPLPINTPCGSNADTDCSNPDTCSAGGVCQPNNEPDGVACTTDNNVCTNDVCAAGLCAHNPVTVGTSCGNNNTTDCDNPDSCDAAGVCQANRDPAGTPCGNMNPTGPCDLPDICDGAGACSPNPAPDTTPCPDATFCDGVETCTGGVCSATGPNPCPPNTTCTEAGGGMCVAGGCTSDAQCNDTNDCTNDSCVIATGTCLNTAKTVGTPCGSPAMSNCDSPDTCNSGGTCLSNNQPDGTACPDTTFCDGAETCTGGVCSATGPNPCPAGTVCNEGTDMCDPATGCTGQPNGTACDDGAFCTINDRCQNQTCVGTPNSCDDAIFCTNDTCDETNNRCVNAPKAAGTPCGSNADTNCDNPDTCNGGVCQTNNEANGTPCPDTTFCDGVETCTGGVCSATGPNPCAAGTVCNEATDMCDAAGACTGQPNGTPCDDGAFCTTGEACFNGACGGGTPRTCTDNIACTTDTCDETNDRCVNTVTTGFCLIGGLCFANNASNPANACQFCNSAASSNSFSNRPAGTACGSGLNTDCDNPDTCNGSGACQANNEADGTACTADANQCTRDICQGGLCTHPNASIGTPCGDATNAPPCNLPDTCNGQGTCQGNQAPNGTDCRDPFFCNGMEVCRGGVCSDEVDPCRSPAHCVEPNICLACTPATAAADCNDNNICTTDTCGAGGLCVNTTIPNCTAISNARGSATKKGSLLVFPNVELKFAPAGAGFVLVQDTFIDIANDYPDDVYVQWYFVNGDAPLAPTFFPGQPPVLRERGHPGWNWVDCQTLLTSDQPAYFAASTGLPISCQSFVILDPGNPPGRPDPDVAGFRTLRGFIMAWAVDQNGNEIQWNHLKGDALIVDYLRGSSSEYNAYAFKALGGVHGEWPDQTPGQLKTNGVEYDNTYDKLLFDFYAANTTVFSNVGVGRTVNFDTDLTLQVFTTDLRQDNDGPVATKAKFDIWNQNEIRLSNTVRCVTCWDQSLLRRYDPINNLVRAAMQTDKGKARIDGEASPDVCRNSVRAPLLGVAVKEMAFLEGAVPRGFAHAAMNLVGQGKETGIIRYDIISGPGELRSKETPGQADVDVADDRVFDRSK